MQSYRITIAVTEITHVLERFLPWQAIGPLDMLDSGQQISSNFLYNMFRYYTQHELLLLFLLKFQFQS